MKKLFAVVGYPLSHSFSTKYFLHKFEREDLSDCNFVPLELENINTFKEHLKFQDGFMGASITIPHKLNIIPLLEDLSREARQIGAVNSIKVRNGKAWGYNTDHVGFAKSIEPLLKAHHKKALILGSGGAAKAVEYGFTNLGVEPKIVSRKAGAGDLLYTDLNENLMMEHTVVVNCTPLGMYPNLEGFPDLPYQHCSERHLFYDLTYNPEVSKFLELGIGQGAAIKNGLEMLHIQAEASWKIWNEA